MLERLGLQRGECVEAAYLDAAEVLDRELDGAPPAVWHLSRRRVARAKWWGDVLLQHDLGVELPRELGADVRWARAGEGRLGERAVDRERALEQAILLGQRLVEAAVLDRDRPLRGERRHERHLDRPELERAPASHIQRADDLLAG